MPFWRFERDSAGTARITISARRQKLRAVLCLVLALGFIAYAVFAKDFIVWRVLIGLFAPVPGVIGIAAWRQGRRGPADIPLLEITDEGVLHEKAGLVRWEEIEDVRLYSMLGQRALGIWTRDPDLVAKRIGKRWLRGMSAVNRTFGWAPMNFSAAGLPIGEMLAEIERRWTRPPRARA